MRADRLLSIVLLLQIHGRLTAYELAERLEVSERTIYRDLEALGMAGIPICTERGPGGGCSLIDGYQTRLTGLTESEIRALFLLQAGPLADLGLGKALDDALLKLSAVLPVTSRDAATYARQRIFLDTASRHHNQQINAHLPIIQQALWQDQRLRLMYSEGNGIWCDDLAEPYGLVCKAGVWYLIAMMQCEMRTLRVSQLQAVEGTQEAFTRQENFDLSSYWTEHKTPQEAAPPLKKAKMVFAVSGNGQRRATGRRYKPKKTIIITGTPISPQKKAPGLLKKTVYVSAKKRSPSLYKKKTGTLFLQTA